MLPTPAVALLAARSRCRSSPPRTTRREYNGVKFFDADGRKLSDASEEEIEALLDAQPAESPGAIDHVGVATDSYLEHIVERFGSDLTGLRIAVDCANGAYSGIAPQAFEQLGAEVTAVAADPDGDEHQRRLRRDRSLALLQRTVTDGGFDLGIAFDGDGDRMLAVDGRRERGRRRPDPRRARAPTWASTCVAVTVMTNLGFHQLMGEHGIEVVVTDVGDRYVLEALRERDGLARRRAVGPRHLPA